MGELDSIYGNSVILPAPVVPGEYQVQKTRF